MGVGRNPGGSLGKWASQIAGIGNPATADFTINDNILLLFGTNSAETAVIVLDSAGLAADAELTNVIVGTSDHQGTAADSLIISNRTTDGDMLFLVSDGGNSLEFMLANADVADLQIGHGMATMTLKTASGDITINSDASLNVTLTVDDADAFDLSNDNSTYYLIDTRNTASGTIAHLIDTEDATIASATGAVYTLWAVPAATYTFTGSTQMTSLQEMMRLVGPTLATDAVALTIDKATTLSLIAPIEGTAGGGTVLTDASALRILNTSGTPVNQHGILIETLTAGATADYMLTLGSTDADHALIHVGVTGDPIFRWDESEDNFSFSKGIFLENDALIRRDVNATITASTSQSQGNGALTAEVNEISAVGSTNDTVTLPTAVAGLKIILINNGANTLQIFPASGDDLGQGTNNATTMVAGNNVVFTAYDATNWESI